MDKKNNNIFICYIITLIFKFFFHIFIFLSKCGFDTTKMILHELLVLLVLSHVYDHKINIVQIHIIIIILI